MKRKFYSTTCVMTANKYAFSMYRANNLYCIFPILVITKGKYNSVLHFFTEENYHLHSFCSHDGWSSSQFPTLRWICLPHLLHHSRSSQQTSTSLLAASSESSYEQLLTWYKLGDMNYVGDDVDNYQSNLKPQIYELIMVKRRQKLVLLP